MRIVVAAGFICVAALPAQAMGASPFDGTWKEDFATARMQQEPDVMILKGGMYTCTSCVPSYTIKADGSDQPITGNPYVDTVAINAPDENNVVVTDKKGGKTTETLTFKLAPGGKSMDVDFKGVGENGAPYSGTAGVQRVAAGPKGSAPISGSWMRTPMKNASDSLMTTTYKVDGDMLTMTDPMGDMYTAKMDGTEAPEKGNAGITSVAVKMTGPRIILESDMRNGKIIETVKSTIASDGHTMTVVDNDKQRHRVTTYTANKQ